MIEEKKYNHHGIVFVTILKIFTISYLRYLTGTLWSRKTFLMEFLSDLFGVLMNLPGIILTLFSLELKMSVFKNLSGTLWRNIQRSSSFIFFVIFRLNLNGK